MQRLAAARDVDSWCGVGARFSARSILLGVLARCRRSSMGAVTLVGGARRLVTMRRFTRFGQKKVESPRYSDPGAGRLHPVFPGTSSKQ